MSVKNVREMQSGSDEWAESICGIFSALGSAPSRRTHCKRGHAFTDANSYVYADGKRRCRECRRLCKYNSNRHAAYNRRYHVGYGLRRRRERIDQRLSEQPITPLGELVRTAVNQIGDGLGSL